MSIHLLDASLAGLAEALMIGLLIAVTLIEAIVMMIMKFNPIGKCFLDSFLVNLASLGIGYLITAYIYPIGWGTENYLGLVIGFIASVGIEGLGLQLLNRKKPVAKVWQASAVMNIVTYLGLLIILLL